MIFFLLVVNLCSGKRHFSCHPCHLAVILGGHSWCNVSEGGSSRAGRVWDPQCPWKLWGSVGRKVQWFWGEDVAGDVSSDIIVHPWLLEVGQWTRQSATLLCHLLYFTRIWIKLQFRPVHMLHKWPRIKSFFDITEGVYAERTGKQKSTEKIFGTSGGVAFLSKEAFLSWHTKQMKVSCVSQRQIQNDILWYCVLTSH